jgi:phage shock protein B
MGSILFFFIPTVIFLGLVVPLWLVLHYLVVWRSSKGLSDDDKEVLSAALHEVDKLDRRVQTLETILDAEQPDWRERHTL